MNCIIVDDETAAIELLEGYVKNVSTLILCGSFHSAVDALHYTQNNPVDLIFLDINMPHLSGLGFLKLLGNKARVVLTTAYSEFALEGYRYDVVDYLTKPIPFENFFRAIQKAEERLTAGVDTPKKSSTEELNDFIMVKSDRKGKLVKVAFSEIIYIQAMGNYVAIYTRQPDRILTLISLKELERHLPKDHFFRTHKTFIIALNQIKMIDGGEIVLLEARNRIPLGGRYKPSFLKRIKHKIMKP